MLRTGFIGCGGIVERRHAPGFKARSDRAPVVAIADLSEERLRVVGEMLGVAPDHRYTDAQRMLEREELDLVDITSPHGLHAEHVIAAAQAGCHVLIEKPIARTPDEARQAIRETHERGVKLCVLHNQAFTPACQMLLAMISAGELGKPFLTRSEIIGGRCATGRGVDDCWRMTVAGSGGGALIDSGYHQTYLMRAWMGSPVKQVFARTGRFLHDYEVEDLSLVLLEHENGGLSSIQSGFCAPAGGVVGMQEVIATEGQARFSPHGAHPLEVWRTATGEWQKVAVPPEGPDELGVPTVLDRFLDAIEGHGEVPVTGEDSLEILNIIHAAYQSARTGQPVAVERP